MPLVQVFKDLPALHDLAWRTISHLDMEHEYWQAIHSVRSMRVAGDGAIERELLVANELVSFRERMTLCSNSIDVEIISGPFSGKKSIQVLSTGQTTTRLFVRWDIRMNGFVCLLSPLITWYIESQNRKALEEMAEHILSIKSA